MKALEYKYVIAAFDVSVHNWVKGDHPGYTWNEEVRYLSRIFCIIIICHIASALPKGFNSDTKFCILFHFWPSSFKFTFVDCSFCLISAFRDHGDDYEHCFRLDRIKSILIEF